MIHAQGSDFKLFTKLDLHGRGEVNLTEFLGYFRRTHADKAGIGFAFGGVEPGTLHAHGQLHERHKVLYSIGLAGEYFLHVRLRQQAKAIPGSPFRLTVLPGPAHARSTYAPPNASGALRDGTPTDPSPRGTARGS